MDSQVLTYLGGNSYITDASGEVYQHMEYFAFGELQSNRENIIKYKTSEQTFIEERNDAEYTRYLFNGKELDEETGNYYYGARYYNPQTSIWLSVDPLADERSWLTPYNFVQNNPLVKVDPNGALDNPIYDTDGNFLGTDDTGIQGDAIVMDKSDFKQGMSNKEATTKVTTLNDACATDCITADAYDKISEHHSNLPSRPDWDGYLTLEEANEWYRTGGGQPLFTDLSKIDLSGIRSLGEDYVGQEKNFNLLLHSGSLNDGLVYGSIRLKRYPNHKVRAYAARYDFDMHNPWNPLNSGRNAQTIIGGAYAGKGTPFEINIYGSATLQPSSPWTK